MGRKLTEFDFGGDLESLLLHCLKLADEAGYDLTAAHIATTQEVLKKDVASKAGTKTRKVTSSAKKVRGPKPL